MTPKCKITITSFDPNTGPKISNGPERSGSNTRTCLMPWKHG